MSPCIATHGVSETLGLKQRHRRVVVMLNLIRARGRYVLEWCERGPKGTWEYHHRPLTREEGEPLIGRHLQHQAVRDALHIPRDNYSLAWDPVSELPSPRICYFWDLSDSSLPLASS